MSTVLNIAAANWSRSEIGILLHRQEEEIKRLKAELEEMTARAVSLALHLPPETLAGDVQRWRDEAKLLLANAPAVAPPTLDSALPKDVPGG